MRGAASVRLKSSGCSQGRCAWGNDPRPPGSSPRSRYSRKAEGRYGRRTSAEGQLLWTSQSIIASYGRALRVYVAHIVHATQPGTLRTADRALQVLQELA